MNSLFLVKPECYFFKKPVDFFQTINLKKDDFVLTSKRFAKKYLFNQKQSATICLFGDYCQGEPTDLAIDRIKATIDFDRINRIVAIGGGSILDVGKLLALTNKQKTAELFESTQPLIREKELILVPTTCGTGSEVTNITVCEITSEITKKGLSDDSLYADKSMLVPDFLAELPPDVFATSAIDALIHAIESYLSPKSTVISQDFSRLAIEKIVSSFQISLKKNNFLTNKGLKLALLGSYYAGIALTNAGVGTIHAMSYPFGTKYHVAHGESNYVFLFQVLEQYQRMDKSGLLMGLQRIIARQLETSTEQAIPCLKSLLHKIFPLKSMSEYGATSTDPNDFSEIVYYKQIRLLKNSPLPISKEIIRDMYYKNLKKA